MLLRWEEGRGDTERPDRHAGRGTLRGRIPLHGPGTGAAPVRRALPPGGIRRRMDRQGSRRGFLDGRHLKGTTIRREEAAAWLGRTCPPVRLAGVGAADADSSEKAAPAAAVCVQQRGDPPAFHVIDTQPLSENSKSGADRSGAVPGVLRHRPATVRSAEPGTTRFRPGPRDAEDTRRDGPRESRAARDWTAGRHRGKLHDDRPCGPRPRPFRPALSRCRAAGISSSTRTSLAPRSRP